MSRKQFKMVLQFTALDILYTQVAITYRLVDFASIMRTAQLLCHEVVHLELAWTAAKYVETAQL